MNTLCEKMEREWWARWVWESKALLCVRRLTLLTLCLLQYSAWHMLLCSSPRPSPHAKHPLNMHTSHYTTWLCQLAETCTGTTTQRSTMQCTDLILILCITSSFFLQDLNVFKRWTSEAVSAVSYEICLMSYTKWDQSSFWLWGDYIWYKWSHSASQHVEIWRWCIVIIIFFQTFWIKVLRWVVFFWKINYGHCTKSSARTILH